MGSISDLKFYKVEAGTFVSSKDKVSLSKVVSAALIALKAEKYDISYVDLNRLYKDYNTGLEKRRFAPFFLWWNKGKLELLRTHRDALFKNLLKNPSKADLVKLLQAAPPTILSESSKEKLAEFVAQLPTEKQAKYVQQFIQGNLQGVLEDVSHRSDFIDRCPEIIEKGILVYNIEALPTKTDFQKILVNTLKQESDVKTIELFFKNNSKEINQVRKNPDSWKLEFNLVRMLEAKYSLLLKKVDQLKEVHGLPFFRILRQGGTFKIGDVEYTVSRKGIESKNPLDPYERLVLVKALVDSGDHQFLQSTFSPSLILQEGTLDEKSISVLKELMQSSDQSIALRAAYILKEAKVEIELPSLDNYKEGVISLEKREVLTFFKDAKFPEKEKISVEKSTSKKITKEPLLKPKFYTVHEGRLISSEEKVSLQKIVSTAVTAIQSGEHKFSTEDLERLYANYEKGLKNRAFASFFLWWNKDKLEVLRNAEGVISPAAKDVTKPFKESFNLINIKKAEFKKQVQYAYDKFLSLALAGKSETQKGNLSEDFQALLKDISKLDELQKKYKKEEQIAEIKLYASLPPFAPPINDIILLYAQDNLPKGYPRAALADLLTIKQNIQKCQRIQDAKDLPAKIEQIKATRSYDNPEDFPFLQVFEYFMNIYARPQQVESIQKLGETDKKKALQLLMGSGKTYLLLPILALMRANGENISSVMVPEELFTEVAKQIHSTLGVSFQRFVTTIPTLTGDPTQAELEKLLNTLKDIKENRGVLLLTPDRKHALLNSLPILLDKGQSEGNDAKVLALLQIESLLRTSENVIGDEIDQLLRSNLQYIVTIGKPKPFEEPQRNIISDLVLHVNEHADDFDVSFDFVKPTDKSIDKPRVSLESYEKEVKPKLLAQTLKLLEQEPGWTALIEKNKASIELILTMKTKVEGDKTAKAAEEFYKGLSKDQKKMLLDLRITIIEVLPKTFFSNCNEDYGVTSSQDSLLAVPFKGTESAAKTKFSNGPEQVVRTVTALLKQGIPVKAFEKTGEKISREEIQKKPDLFRKFLRDHALTQIEIHPERAMSDGQKLVSSSQYFSGISGTFWNVTTFAHFDELVADAESEVQSILKLSEKADKNEVTFVKVEPKPKDVVLLELVTAEKKPLALIDSGGWLRNVKLKDFIQDILIARTDLEVVVYKDEKGNLVAVDREGKIVPYNKDVPAANKRFTIYQKQDTTGVDIPQSEKALAILTLGKQMILRDAQQSTFRMRKILEAQELQIAYDDEAADQIEQLISWDKKEPLDFPTYTKFLITSQVMKLLPDNYQSVRQRMRDALEAKVRTRMCELAKEGKVDEIRELFTAAREFFIETEADDAPETWAFPVKVDKETKISEDIKSYVDKFKNVNKIIGIEGEDLDTLLRACYDPEQLDDEIETGGLSKVGQEILIQDQQKIQSNKEISVVKLDLEQITKTLEDAYANTCIPTKVMSDEIERFKQEVKNLSVEQVLEQAKILHTQMSELHEIQEISKQLDVTKNEISMLEAIQKTVGSNKVIQSYLEKKQLLQESLDIGLTEAKNRLVDFENAEDELGKELIFLQKIVDDEVKLLHEAGHTEPTKIDIQDPLQLEKFEKLKKSIEVKKEDSLKQQKLLEQFISKGNWKNGVPVEIQKEVHELLESFSVASEIERTTGIKRIEKLVDAYKTPLSQLQVVIANTAQIDKSIIGLRNLLIEEGFKSFEQQFQLIIEKQNDVALLEKLISLKEVSELGFMPKVKERFDFLDQKAQVKDELSKFCEGKNFSEGLQSRIHECSKRFSKVQTTISLDGIRKEVKEIQEAYGWQQEALNKFKLLDKNVFQTLLAKKFFEELETTIEECSFQKTQYLEITGAITQLANMTGALEELLNETIKLETNLKKNQIITAKCTVKEVQSRIEQDKQHRLDLVTISNKINTFKPTSLTDLQLFTLSQMDELQSKQQVFIEGRQKLTSFITQQEIKAKEFLSQCKESLTNDHPLWDESTKALELHGIKLLNKTNTIRQAFTDFAKTKIDQQLKHLDELTDRIEQVKGKISKKNEKELLETLKKVASLKEKKHSTRSVLKEAVEGIEALDKLITSAELLIEKRDTFQKRADELFEQVGSLFSLSLGIDIEKSIHTLEKEMRETDSLEEFNGLEKRLNQIEKTLQTQIDTVKFEKNILSQVSVLKEGVLDSNALNDLTKLLEDSRAKKLFSRKESREILLGLIMNLAERGEIKHAKSIADMVGIGGKKIVAQMQAAFLRFSREQMDDELGKIADVFFESDENGFDFDNLRGSFELLYIAHAQKIAAAFELAGFSEVFIHKALNNFAIEGAKARLNLNLRVLAVVTPVVGDLLKNNDEVALEEVDGALNWVDVAIDQLKTFENATWIESSAQLKLESAMKELQESRTILASRINQLKTTEYKIKQVRKTVFTTLALGACTFTAFAASPWIGTSTGMFLAKKTFDQLAGIVIDPLVDTTTNSLLPKSIAPYAATLLKAGIKMQLDQTYITYQKSIIQGIANISKGVEDINNMNKEFTVKNLNFDPNKQIDIKEFQKEGISKFDIKEFNQEEFDELKKIDIETGSLSIHNQQSKNIPTWKGLSNEQLNLIEHEKLVKMQFEEDEFVGSAGTGVGANVGSSFGGGGTSKIETQNQKVEQDQKIEEIDVEEVDNDLEIDNDKFEQQDQKTDQTMLQTAAGVGLIAMTILFGVVTGMGPT